MKVDVNINLSPLQEKALVFLNKNKISLLFGDTGSGKSEIYFKLFEKTINSGKSCIFLLPEISLTPQMTKRLKEKFGDLIAIWHSKITKKKKEEILEKIERDEVKIVMGARSALFLPMKNLGVIVVDEEHDDSYKSNSRPRYHARDIAVYMGQKLGAKVVLGSATPSLTSYKKFPSFRVKQSFFKSSKSYEFIQNNDFISEYVLEKIKKTLDENSQVIIFLPTRGNFKYLSCKSCGSGVKCPFCDIGMSIHKSKNALVCHYCNYHERVSRVCPSCKSEDLSVNRVGTAEITNVLSEIFSEKKIAQFDKDTVSTQRKLNSILKDFAEKKIDILVGTQMLSKGHDYHDVKLVVVFDIDTILNMADFRSRWRAMSLLLQVSGRVGRKGSGEIVVQSSNKEFFESYLDDFEEFLKDEAQFSKELYPPYKKLLKVLIAHKDRQKALNLLEEVQQRVNSFDLKDIEVVGFGEAPISRIAGKYRFQALFRSPSSRELLKLSHYLNIQGVEIDIDPVNFA